jgi:hypothetical protein
MIGKVTVPYYMTRIFVVEIKQIGDTPKIISMTKGGMMKKWITGKRDEHGQGKWEGK